MKRNNSYMIRQFDQFPISFIEDVIDASVTANAQATESSKATGDAEVTPL